MKRMKKDKKFKIGIWTFDHRYPLFFSSLILLFILPDVFEVLFGIHINFMLPFSLVVLSSIFLVQASRRSYIISIFLVIFLIIFDLMAAEFVENRSMNMILFSLLFFYFIWVTFFLFKDLYGSKTVTWQMIVGAFSGYFLIGVLGFFLLAFIEMEAPGSFSMQMHSLKELQALFYFSFVTMTTIGYGDILPVSNSARSAAILLALFGQFYLAIIMAIMVGKFLSRPTTNEK